MIGVSISPLQRDIAKEFFELFKTPWEFYQDDGKYDVVLSTSGDFCGEASQLLIIFGGESGPNDLEGGRPVKSPSHRFVVSEEGKRMPIYTGLETFPGSQNSVLKEESTLEPAAFVSHCGNITVLKVGYNLFEEARFLLVAGQPADNAGVAALEEHIAWLRDWITLAGIPLIEIPPIPDGYRFIACLTHDIDHPALRNHFCDHTMFGFLYRATIGSLISVCRGRKPAESLWKNWNALCRLPLVYLGIAKDSWSGFDRYLEMETGFASTFFVIPRKGYPGHTDNGFGSPRRACGYDIEQVLPQLKRIVSAGGEVGVHGLDAWLDVDEGRKERERVSEAISAKELGVRMHWLFFNENSPAVLDRAGYTYDTTVGYRETVGYRAGTTQAYRPLGVTNLLELPLHVMDTALFYPGYLNLSEKKAERLVWELLDDAERLGGALTFNWHDRSIAPERLWDDFYLRLLRELKRRGAWSPTAAQAVAWFRKRRSAAVEYRRVDPGVIRVRGRLETVDTLPGLKIRIHKPRARSLKEPVAARKAPEFVDASFHRTTEFNMAI